MPVPTIIRAPAFFYRPEGAPVALFAAPWRTSVRFDVNGVYVSFDREEGDRRAYVVVSGNRVGWGVQARDGSHVGPGIVVVDDLGQAYEQATAALEAALAGTGLH